jgi:hypothetical protein
MKKKFVLLTEILVVGMSYTNYSFGWCRISHAMIARLEFQLMPVEAGANLPHLAQEISMLRATKFI